MKKSIIILFALLLVMGCENGENNPPLNFLVGTWDVVEFSTDDGNTWEAESETIKYEYKNDGYLIVKIDGSTFTSWYNLCEAEEIFTEFVDDPQLGAVVDPGCTCYNDLNVGTFSYQLNSDSTVMRRWLCDSTGYRMEILEKR